MYFRVSAFFLGVPVRVRSFGHCYFRTDNAFMKRERSRKGDGARLEPKMEGR